MENASKALVIAGSVMFTMLIVTVMMYGWNTMSEYQAEMERIKEIEKVAIFNQQFTNYQREDLLGYEVLSLVNKVIDYNQRHSSAGESTGSAAGNDSSYKPITIKIAMGSNLSNLRGTIEKYSTSNSDDIYALSAIPKEEIFDASKYGVLFEEDAVYTVSEAKMSNDFQTKVLDVIKNIEQFDKGIFGGPTGIQNLVKNIGTIYSGPVINYNGKPEPTEASFWYDMNYIVSRYKTLTGIAITGASDKDKIDKIRDDDNIKKVLKYHEYSQFKKGIFKCTGINYDDGETRRRKFR